MIKTERLILRKWRDEDLLPFAELNADPCVREFFLSTLDPQTSNEHIKYYSNHIEKYGYGFWAVSLISTGEFIGFIGIQNVHFKAHFTPAVEIGWRLAFNHWGKGYATEGAKAALRYAFETLKLDEIVSMASMKNMRSRHVMEKIGMHHDPKDDFDYPEFPKDDFRRKFVLYRLKRNEWEEQNKTSNII